MIEVKRTLSWKQILKRHNKEFLSWLDKTNCRETSFNKIATQLENFLKLRLAEKEECLLFWNNIPEVRAGCNKSETYEQPLAAESYAYVHFLDRYRRIWDVCLHLLQRGVLPLSNYSLQTLDIGTGPASALYAIEDFYLKLLSFAEENSISELNIPVPTLFCIEKSESMIRFFHHFSEFTNRRGLFSALVDNFEGIDFSELRYDKFEEFTDQIYDDNSVNGISTLSDANDAAQRMYRFRLIILSNFLTLSESVDAFENELVNLFSDLRPGGVALIIGAYGKQYPQIYSKLEKLAVKSRVRRIEWIDEKLGEDSWVEHARRIKEFHYSIYNYLTKKCSEKKLKRSGYPDYWRPSPSKKVRPAFGLRVFRKGRI